jgi:hypothetical protein
MERGSSLPRLEVSFATPCGEPEESARHHIILHTSMMAVILSDLGLTK